MRGGRGYEQYCPMAAALDLVGDRWALLVVRELVLGPRRFGELSAGLVGIPTDVLTARLRALEDVGVLVRVGAGRAGRYRLTPRGHDLRPVLAELGRWGSVALGLPSSPDAVSPRLGLTALLLVPPPAPAGVAGTFAITVGDESACLLVEDATITLVDVVDDPPFTAGTQITVSQLGLIALLVGERATNLVRSGELVIAGARRDATRVLDALAAPDVLAGLADAR